MVPVGQLVVAPLQTPAELVGLDRLRREDQVRAADGRTEVRQGGFQDGVAVRIQERQFNLYLFVPGNTLDGTVGGAGVARGEQVLGGLGVLGP